MDTGELHFGNGFRAGQKSCAATEWRSGPPPEQEGLEVLVEAGSVYWAGETERIESSGRWTVQTEGTGLSYSSIARHAIIHPKEQP